MKDIRVFPKVVYKKVILSGIMLMMSGCMTLGPDYNRPEVTLQENWLESQKTPLLNESPQEKLWWKTAFNEPQINELIELALKQNLSLRSAGLKVLQSQQQLAIAIGNQYPQQQQLSGGKNRNKSDSVVFNQYDLGFNLSWEIDFWGRFKRQIESASENLEASVANYDEIVVSLISQVAQTYILIRTYQDRVQVARQNIHLQKESLRIARAKFRAGDVSELDVDQAETLLNNTKATVPSLETSLQQFKNNLSFLLGKPPQELNYLLQTTQAIPSTRISIALGMPQDIIRQRPDIRAAEHRLAAQSAQIGFAQSDLYPHLFIGGSIGTSASHSNDLFESQSEVWDVFGLFEWKLFNYGRLKSNVRLQDARFQQLLVDYRNAILQSQVEIENAIVAYFKSHEQLKSYKLAAEASQRAIDVSKTQYQNGLIDFNTVISTLRAHVQQLDLLSSTQGTVATNLVQVYKALGGGWKVRNDQDPVDLLPSDMKEIMRDRTKYWEDVLH